MKMKIDLDFSKCKTKEDVDEVFKKHKKELDAVKQFREFLSTSKKEGTELSLKVPSQSSDKPCPKCNGTGKVYDDGIDYEYMQDRYATCEDCKGTGKARL